MAGRSGGRQTIKQLVFDHVRRTRGAVDYAELTREVLASFPTSKWKLTHWSWYKSQIVSGRFKSEFTAEIRDNLRAGVTGSTVTRPMSPQPPGSGQVVQQVVRGPAAHEPKVKELADPILAHVRHVLSLAAGDDPILRFKLNRWICARLQQDERRLKQPIKQALWDKGSHACQGCGKEFRSLRNVELHRKRSSLDYSIENCELLCRDCHTMRL